MVATQIFFIFTPIWGNDPILTNIFQMGWNHQLEVEFRISKISAVREKVFLDRRFSSRRLKGMILQGASVDLLGCASAIFVILE